MGRQAGSKKGKTKPSQPKAPAAPPAAVKPVPAAPSHSTVDYSRFDNLGDDSDEESPYPDINHSAAGCPACQRLNLQNLDFSKPAKKCPDHQPEPAGYHSSDEDGHNSTDEDEADIPSSSQAPGSSEARAGLRSMGLNPDDPEGIAAAIKSTAAAAAGCGAKQAPKSSMQEGFFSKPGAKQPVKPDCIPRAPAPAVPDGKKSKGLAAGFLSKGPGGAAKPRPASGSSSAPSAARSAGASSGLVRWASPFDLAPEASHWISAQQAEQAAPQLTMFFVKFWVQQCCLVREEPRMQALRRCLDHFIQLDLEDAMQHYARQMLVAISCDPTWQPKALPAGYKPSNVALSRGNALMHYCLSKADAKQPGSRLDPRAKLHTARQEFYEVSPRDSDLDLVNAYLLQEQAHLRSQPDQSDRAASTTRIIAKLRDLPLQYTGLFAKDIKPSAQPPPSKAAPAAAAAAPSAQATGSGQQASSAAPATSQAAATPRSPEPSPRPGAQGKAGSGQSRATTQPDAGALDLAAQAAAVAASPAQSEQATRLRSDRQPQPPPSVKHAPYNPAAPESFSTAEVQASYAARRQAEAAAELEDDWGSDEDEEDGEDDVAYDEEAMRKMRAEERRRIQADRAAERKRIREEATQREKQLKANEEAAARAAVAEVEKAAARARLAEQAKRNKKKSKKQRQAEARAAKEAAEPLPGDEEEEKRSPSPPPGAGSADAQPAAPSAASSSGQAAAAEPDGGSAAASAAAAEPAPADEVGSEPESPGVRDPRFATAYDLLEEADGGSPAAGSGRPSLHATAETAAANGAAAGQQPQIGAPARRGPTAGLPQPQNQPQHQHRPQPAPAAHASQLPAPRPRPATPAAPPQLLELQAAASSQSMPRLETAISAADDWLSFARGLIRTLFEPQMRNMLRDARAAYDQLRIERSRPQPQAPSRRPQPGPSPAQLSMAHIPPPPPHTGTQPQRPAAYGLGGPAGRVPARPMFQPPIQSAHAPPHMGRAAPGQPPVPMHPMQMPAGFRPLPQRPPHWQPGIRGPAPPPPPRRSPMPAVPPRSSVPVLDKGPVGLGAAVAAGAHDPDSEEACVVCLDKPREVVFYPCGHAVACWDCTLLLQSQAEALCPMCRIGIQETMVMGGKLV